MHDSKNALSVQRLIADLAGTLRTMNGKDQELAEDFGSIDRSWMETWATAFWETVSREWASIDQWRMNKILLLVRIFLREQFELGFSWAIKEGPKPESQVSKQIRTLEAWPLSPRERKVPDGLRLHVLDIWSEEMDGQLSAAQEALANAEDGDAEGGKTALLDTVKEFNESMRQLSREALSKGVRTKAKEAVKLWEERISLWRAG